MSQTRDEDRKTECHDLIIPQTSTSVQISAGCLDKQRSGDFSVVCSNVSGSDKTDDVVSVRERA